MISEHVKFLEDGFNVLNRLYFNNELPKAVVTTQSSPKSYGYITLRKVWEDKESGEQYREINISAEHLARPVECVFATLMHEMVHLYCLENNIKDVSNNGRYHNKKFKVQAEKRDLIIEYANIIGWSKTAPSQQFIQKIKDNGLDKNIEHERSTEKIVVLPKGKKKSSTRKYVCPQCRASVRATKDINIVHKDCGVQMIKEE